MKIGEMLVRDGRLEQSDLEKIIAQQTEEGGRIGSLLVTEKLITAETLTVYLGLELGIPIATTPTLERCKRSAVQLLSPEQARQFHCIPIIIQGQTLIVALVDPHDMQVLDEIATTTGYRVIPRVAPEICIHRYLEHYYGIAQPERFAAVASLVNEGEVNPADQDLPAPPLPGLPPQVATPVVAPTPAPPAHSEARSSQRDSVHDSANLAAVPVELVDTEDTEKHEALELDAADLVEELEADEEQLAQEAQRQSLVADVSTEESDQGHQEPSSISYPEAKKILCETRRRGAIAEALLAHAARIFDVATLLLVRDELAFGWKGFGPGITSDRIESLLMPLQSSSILRLALQSDTKHFRGHPFPGTLHSHWFRILRCNTPEFCVVVVCSIGKRTVNLLYGHKSDGSDISDEQMDNLEDLMSDAGAAYVRLISKSKRDESVSPDSFSD